MDNNNDIQTSTTDSFTSTVGKILWRLITSAIVLAITAFFTPGFTIQSIWALIVASIVLTTIDYLISMAMGIQSSSFSKGLTGFILAGITLYVIQYFVAGYSISWMAAIIGALIYGVIDYFI